MCCVFCHGLEESPRRWGSQNWKTNVASSYRTAATVRRRRSWRPALVGLGGWGTVPVLGSPACLESWPSSDSMRAGVPGLPAVDAGRFLPHCWPMGQGARTGEGESNHETSQRPSSIASFPSSSPSLSISPFSPSPPLPVASAVPSIRHPAPAASPETFQEPIFWRLLLSSPSQGLICPTAPSFDSRPILCLFRRISSCPISFLLSSLLASDKPLPSIQGLQARPPATPSPTTVSSSRRSIVRALVCFPLDHPPPLRPSHVPIPITTRIQVPNVALSVQSCLD